MAEPVVAPVCVPQQSRIPKIIHLTFKEKTGLPEAIAANLRDIAALNPDFALRLYDDAAVREFIRSAYGAAILAIFDRLSPKYGAARADLFRYLCIYKLGGVYLDIKAGVTRPLSSVIHASDQYLLAQWDPVIEDGRFSKWGRYPEISHVAGGEFQQWHVIAAPGHPFLQAVIEEVLRRIQKYAPFRDGAGRLGVLRTTGPIVYTQAIFPLRDQHPHRMVRAEADLGLHYSVYDHRQAQSHLQHFSQHYSTQIEPLVWRGGLIDRSFVLSQRALRMARAIWQWRRRWRTD